jgi:hypothetical protein
VEIPLKKYPININIFMRVANATLTIRLISIIATVGLESWQICFGDSEHLIKVAIILLIELDLTGGERRGCVSDDSTELTSTFARSITF